MQRIRRVEREMVRAWGQIGCGKCVRGNSHPCDRNSWVCGHAFTEARFGGVKYLGVLQKRRLDQKTGHLGIGDMELVHKDVCPVEIFQREGVQSEQRGGAALSLSFAPRLQGSRGGTLGRNGQRGRRETVECDVSETNTDAAWKGTYPSFLFCKSKPGNIGKLIWFNLVREKPEKVTHDLSLRNVGRDIGAEARLVREK